MHRDPTLHKRNALVIPGVLLVLVSLVGILYAQFLRSDEVVCEDGRLVFFLGACRSALLLLVIPLALGGLLIGLGARLRSEGTCHLGHGTAATTGLAVLIAAVVLPALAALAIDAIQDPDVPYVLTRGEVDYGIPRLLGGAALIGLLLLIPYLLLYLGTARPPACCRAKACFDPCYCDEAAEAPPIPAFPPPAEPRPEETAQVTTSPWPPPAATPRTRPSLVPISAPIVPTEAAPQQPDAPVAADSWPTPTNDFAANVPSQEPEPRPLAGPSATDPWPAAPAAAQDPWPATKKGEGAWTPPAPVEEDTDPLPAKGGAAKGKGKAPAKPAAKGKEKPAPKAAKQGRKISGKKKA